MHVKQTDLGNSRRAHEACLFIKLRTSLHAAAARDAAGKGISLLLLFRGDTRAGAKIIGAIDRNPRFNGFKVFEDNTAIRGQVADDWELRERFKSYGLFEIVDQRRTSHARAPVDEHGARAAYFLEAIRVVSDRHSRLAVAGDGVRGNLHQRRDHIHAGMPGEFELFPVRLGSGGGLALDL